MVVNYHDTVVSWYQKEKPMPNEPEQKHEDPKDQKERKFQIQIDRVHYTVTKEVMTGAELRKMGIRFDPLTRTGKPKNPGQKGVARNGKSQSFLHIGFCPRHGRCCWTTCLRPTGKAGRQNGVAHLFDCVSLGNH